MSKLQKQCHAAFPCHLSGELRLESLPAALANGSMNPWQMQSVFFLTAL